MTVAARAQSGFALVIVLWTVGLLALLGSHIAAGARTAAGISGGLRGAAVAGAAADGVINQAIFHLLDHGRTHWDADGTPHRIDVPGGTAIVAITDNAGRINPGNASADMLAALLRHTGVPPDQARALGASILDWRTAGLMATRGGTKAAQYAAAGHPYGPPRSRYETLDELHLVLGMTPAIYDRIVPFLSVHTAGGVDLRRAHPVVAAALAEVSGPGAPPLQPPADGGVSYVQIDSAVTLAGGIRAQRHAEVQIGTDDDDAIRPYRIVAWD